MDIKTRRAKLIKRKRREVEWVNRKYRRLIDKLDAQCTHEWSEPFLPLNPDFAYDLFGNPIYMTRCRLCRKEKYTNKEGTT